MEIGVIGAGAMGTFLSGILGRDHPVDLLGRKDRDIKTIEITGETSLESSVNYTVDPSDFSNEDLIIVCTKSFDTEEAIGTLSEYISSDSLVLTLQNGLENEEIISDYVGKSRTIGGVTSHGITFKKPGKVKHAGKGDTIIGPYPKGLDERLKRVKNVSEEFNTCGLETKISENIVGHIWKKAIINSAINPLTALTEVKNGLLVDDPDLFELMKNTALESYHVAERYVDLPVDDVVDETMKVAEQTSENISSMLQDKMKGNKTEVEQINGALVDKGKRYDISTPINKVLYRLIKGMENSYL